MAARRSASRLPLIEAFLPNKTEHTRQCTANSADGAHGSVFVSRWRRTSGAEARSTRCAAAEFANGCRASDGERQHEQRSGGNDCCSSSGSSATRSFGTSRSESGASRDASPVPRAVPLLNLPTDAARPMENGSSSQGGHGGSSTARSFGTSRSGSGTSRDVSPQRQEGSPTVMRGALSTRFRAERALVAMAQRTVSWQGPELWIVTGASRFDVLLGPPLRDLPAATEHALATVFRSIGMQADGGGTIGSQSNLLVVRDGWVTSPWVPSELRNSREHVICITTDVLPRDEPIPTQCSAELMGLLAGYAQRRLQQENNTGSRAYSKASAPSNTDETDSLEDETGGWRTEEEAGEEEAEGREERRRRKKHENVKES